MFQIFLSSSFHLPWTAKLSLFLLHSKLSSSFCSTLLSFSVPCIPPHLEQPLSDAVAPLLFENPGSSASALILQSVIERCYNNAGKK